MNPKRITILAVFLLAPLLMAMDMLGGPQVRERAPEPNEIFNVQIVDKQGVTTRVAHISYDGELYVPVYLGTALVTVPFKKIDKIDFGEKKKARIEIAILFKDGEKATFWLDNDILFIGKVPYGTFQIQARDVKQIAFEAQP